MSLQHEDVVIVRRRYNEWGSNLWSIQKIEFKITFSHAWRPEFISAGRT